jgi:hypothetical protein
LRSTRLGAPATVAPRTELESVEEHRLLGRLEGQMRRGIRSE